MYTPGLPAPVGKYLGQAKFHPDEEILTPSLSACYTGKPCGDRDWAACHTHTLGLPSLCVAGSACEKDAGLCREAEDMIQR